MIGAPAWDRAWSLPLWFQSVRANVDPGDTGLVFVVPPNDGATRDVIADNAEGFGWVEVLRDRGAQSNRQERPATGHRNLAAVRNQVLQVVERARPARFLSWDTDFLVPPASLDHAAGMDLPLVAAWGWLNRQPPRPLRYRGADGKWANVLYQDPACFTAMSWARRAPRHYPAEQFLERSGSTWRTHIALAWQLMDQRAYRVAAYAPHPSGEDVPFNMRLAARGVPRWCAGEVQGLHLYDRTAKDETALGWPGVMALAEQAPLAATWRGERSPEHQALGFFLADQIEQEMAA